MKKEKKEKKPGRVALICNRCEAKFSTHSSNRDVCYSCKPKCKEIHYFYGDAAKVAAEAKAFKEIKEGQFVEIKNSK